MLISSSIFSASIFTVKWWCCSGEDTIPLISCPNVSITSSRCLFIYVYIFFSFVIYMFILLKECLFTLVITRYPKCTFKPLIFSSITFGFTWYALLSLTYQIMVHCFPYNIFWPEIDNRDWSRISFSEVYLCREYNTAAQNQCTRRCPSRQVDIELFVPDIGLKLWVYITHYINETPPQL